MTIYDKTQDEKILFPVGIGIIQTETVRNFYNTSDATATSSDIIIGKTAYSRYGMIKGELDIQDRIETSYQEGYEFGYDEGNDAGYVLGKEDGYNDGYNVGKTDGTAEGYNNGFEVGKSEGYNDGYNVGKTDGTTEGYNNGFSVGKNEGLEEGLADGKVLGREEIIEQQSDATITPDKVLNGFIGYGKNNERIVGESDAITTIDVGAIKLKFGYSDFSQIPSYYNFDNVTSVSHMFYNCSALKSVPLFSTARCGNMSSMFYYCGALKTVPQFNTINVTDMSNMFYNCSALTSVPLFNTSKVTNMSSMFGFCAALTSIPQFDTSNVTSMSNMFNYCRSLIDVPKLDTKKCNNFSGMFTYCDSLVSVSEFDFSGYIGSVYAGSEIFGTSYNYPPNLTTIGGFKDIGKAYSGASSPNKDIPLQYLSKLTRESILNVFNKVYDMNLNTAQTGEVRIKLHANVKALLSDEDIAIATNKGWTVQ